MADVTAEMKLRSIRYWDNEIAKCEKQHGMSSKQMREHLLAGTLEETSDICSWLIAVDARKRLSNWLKQGGG